MVAEVIQADYDSLAAVANRFGYQAELIGQIIDRVGRTKESLVGSGWQGRGALEFDKELDFVVLPAAFRLQQALTEARQISLNIVDVLRSAEDEAANLFHGQGDNIISVGDFLSDGDSPDSTGGPRAPILSIEQILEKGKANADRVFNESYMEDMIGHTEIGADNKQLNQSMEDLLNKIRSGERDITSVGPILDKIAEIRDIDPSVLREQYETVFLPLWDNSPSKGTIDLGRHPDFMGSTVSLRYGRVVGDVFGMDPVWGAMLNPTGGLVGSGNNAYQPSRNDAIGYHGIFHDAGGYLYNFQNHIGPGYDYLAREPFPTSSPLSGQVGGISWWAGKPYLSVDILPHVMPDFPYVPEFVEQAAGNLIEGVPVSVLRQGMFVWEGTMEIASDLGGIFGI